MGFSCGGEGASRFWAPGRGPRPRRRGLSGCRWESLRAEAGAEAAAQGAHGCCPRKGARTTARRHASRRGLGPRAVVTDSVLGLPPSPVLPGPGLGARSLREHAPLPRSYRCRALSRSRALGGVPGLGAECRAFSRRPGSPGYSEGRGSSLPGGEEAPWFVDRDQGLACGRPEAADQPELPVASLTLAATAVAPAAACSALAARGGEERRAFPEVGASGDAWGNLDSCCP